jgi:hypothetical protein
MICALVTAGNPYMATNSAAQLQAQSQAQRLFRDVDSYRQVLPPQSRHHGGGGMCRADGWNVSNDQLDGDFDLDDVLAKDIVSSALGNNVRSMRSVPSASSAATTSSTRAADKAWLEQYLYGDSAGSVGSTDRFISEGKSAVAGPGNVLDNVNALKQAANAAVQTKSANALKAGAQQIASGAASSIKINQYMTLYNANKSGKGPPRPRLRIQGLPMQVITPALGPGARMAAQHGSTSARALALGGKETQHLGKFAASQHWSSAGSLLNGKMGTGILTFAPSAALDVYNSFEQDLRGDSRFNWQKFGVASAKSQSGNLLGLGAGAIAGGIAVVGFGAVGAPVILVSLFVGVTAQVIWGATGMSDKASSAAERALTK